MKLDPGLSDSVLVRGSESRLLLSILCEAMCCYTYMENIDLAFYCIIFTSVERRYYLPQGLIFKLVLLYYFPIFRYIFSNTNTDQTTGILYKSDTLLSQI